MKLLLIYLIGITVVSIFLGCAMSELTTNLSNVLVIK